MDPRQLFDPSSGKAVHDDTYDESSDNCTYNSYSSVSCTNGECVKETHQFRQCGDRPVEELIEDDDGHEHWVPADPDDAMESGFTVSIDNNLQAINELLEDSFVSAMMGLQSKLINELLEPLDEAIDQSNNQHPPRSAIITRHKPIDSNDQSNNQSNKRSTFDRDESIVQTPVDAIADRVHNVVDYVFGRKPSRSDQSTKRKDEP